MTPVCSSRIRSLLLRLVLSLTLIPALAVIGMQARAADELTAILGSVYNDAAGNGAYDSNASTIGNVTITLLDSNNTTVATTTTDPDIGMYGFFNVPVGIYTVVETVPAGYTATGANAGDGSGGTVINTTKIQVSATTAYVTYMPNDFMIHQTSSATFIKTDSTTEGSWQGVYGSQGYNIIGYAANYPSYATVGVSDEQYYTWANTTYDARALVKPDAPDHFAGTWYSATSFTIDVNLTDGQTHQVAIQGMDWESAGRAQRVDILDAASGATLDSENLVNFASVSKFLVWNLQGHVQIKITCTGGSNAVVSGLFFDPDPVSGASAPGTPTDLTARAGNGQVILAWNGSADATSYNIKRSTTAGGPYTTISTAGLVTGTNYTDSTVTNGTTYYYVVSAVNSSNIESANSNEASTTPSANITSSATFVKTDTTTQGSWKGVYGSGGYNVIEDTVNYPSYATVGVSNNQPYIWADPTTDLRALSFANASGRLAACWYNNSSFTIDLSLADGLTHQIALYALDWENGSRTEHIDIIDASTGTVLDTQSVSAFTSGKYLVWNIKGHVQIKITVTSGENAVLSGLFFD